MHKGTA
jgi:hypothetical protein